VTVSQRLVLATLFVLGTELAAFSQSSDLSTIIENLRSGDDKIRLEAARNLFNASDTAPDLSAVVNRIAPLLSSPDVHVRLAVLASFEKMDLLHPEQGPTIAKSKAALMKAMEDPLEDVRQYALAVLE
jgi:hypothetical protein